MTCSGDELPRRLPRQYAGDRSAVMRAPSMVSAGNGPPLAVSVGVLGLIIFLAIMGITALLAAIV
jgi:hypothetical protein